MNLGSINFCQTEERGLRPDTTVAFFATVAAGRVEQPSCTGGIMMTLSQNHFVGLHEMVSSAQALGVEMTSLKDHSEELLGMVPFEQSAVKTKVRDYSEELGV